MSKHNYVVPSCSTANTVKGRYSKFSKNSDRAEVLPVIEHITTHDTFQKLNYDTKIPFNALWPPKDIVDAHVDIHDASTESIIGKKLIKYVSPAVDLYKVDDSTVRKRMIEYIYTTTSLDADKDARWNLNTKRNFSPTKCHLHSTSYDIVENEESMQKEKELQNISNKNLLREFLRSTGCNISHKGKLQKLVSTEIKDTIKVLIEKDTLSIIYDKLPLSYGGHRSEFGIGVKLERKNLPVGHPDLTVSQALARRYEDDASL